jgi:predicted MFS family arabinose efflux permease
VAPPAERPAPGGRGPASASRWSIIGLILAAQTLANVGPLGIPAIAPLIQRDLGLTLAQAGSFLSVYYIGPSLMSLPAGAMADRWGIKRVLVAGQVVIGLGLIAASAAPSYAALCALLVVAGFGYGLLNPTSTKAVLAWSPPSQRATLVGLKQVGLPFGGALGAAAMPVLALFLDWRRAVGLAGAIIGVAAVASAWLYRDPPGRPAAPPAGGARSPLRAVLATRDLWLVALATCVFAGMQTVWMAFLVLYLQQVVGLSLLAAGRCLALAQVAGMAGRVVFGVLSDRLFGGNRRLPLALAGLGSTLCSLALAATGPGTPTLWLAPLALVFGFAGIGWNGVQHTLMAELAGPRAAGTAVGLGLAVSSLGVTVGPPLFGYAVDASASFRAPWAGLAAIMLVGLALLALVRERDWRRHVDAP